MKRKKLRGIRQKCNKIEARILSDTSEFPEINDDYWYLLLPATQDFVNSPKLPLKIKIRLLQFLIDRANYLIKVKPNDDYRIVVMIFPNNLWESQLIIFPDDKTYRTFFDRNKGDQRWIPLSNDSQFEYESYLSFQNDFSLWGYQEYLFEYTNNIPVETNLVWFIGNN